MPKFEEEPGVYSTRKPRPEKDRKTTKVRLNMETLDQRDIDEIEPEVIVSQKTSWEKNRPGDLKTLTSCPDCREAMSELVWNTSSENQSIEPVFSVCDEHPELNSDWVYELLGRIVDRLNE
ncbi:MAG: hypothetical protein ABEK50_18850 [bacterium]